MNTKSNIILLNKLLVQHEITELGSDTLMAAICPLLTSGVHGWHNTFTNKLETRKYQNIATFFSVSLLASNTQLNNKEKRKKVYYSQKCWQGNYIWRCFLLRARSWTKLWFDGWPLSMVAADPGPATSGSGPCGDPPEKENPSTPLHPGHYTFCSETKIY